MTHRLLLQIQFVARVGSGHARPILRPMNAECSLINNIKNSFFLCIVVYKLSTDYRSERSFRNIDLMMYRGTIKIPVIIPSIARFFIR